MLNEQAETSKYSPICRINGMYSDNAAVDTRQRNIRGQSITDI